MIDLACPTEDVSAFVSSSSYVRHVEQSFALQASSDLLTYGHDPCPFGSIPSAHCHVLLIAVLAPELSGAVSTPFSFCQAAFVEFEAAIAFRNASVPPLIVEATVAAVTPVLAVE